MAQSPPLQMYTQRTLDSNDAMNSSSQAHSQQFCSRVGAGVDDDDAEDYYDYLPSDSDSDDTPIDDDVRDNNHVKLQQTLTMSGRVAAALAHDTIDTSAVLTPISTLGATNTATMSVRHSSRHVVQRPSHEILAQVATGAVMLTGSKTLHLSPESLAQHATRKSELERALDALSMNTAPPLTDNINSSAVNANAGAGEAPFRFRALRQELPTSIAVEATDDVDMVTAAPAPPAQVPSTATDNDSSDDDDEVRDVVADPLYDDAQDDADEQWVQRNFRMPTATTTDATLCCPCCFMTVCMDCQRHVQYTNQYRASVAINCRINKDDVLTYTRDGGGATQPFDKRLHRTATAAAGSKRRATRAQLLQTADEFHPVVCSDCGTTVGVFDREQQYHFFNVLPSHC